MGKRKGIHDPFKIWKNNNHFIDSAILNNATFEYYMDLFQKLCLSIFEWVNLPKSMNSIWLEKCLFFQGQAGLLFDNSYGFINTNVASSGTLNLYGLPTKLNCWSFDYRTERNLYTGLENENQDDSVILVQNDWFSIPTANEMGLFALRLYECDRTCDVNIKAQKTPVLLLCDETQRLMLLNLYKQYDGNQPFIMGDKNQFSDFDSVKSIKTEAPFIADKISDYKKKVLNEALTYLGINNIMEEKKERLVSDEANSNNEMINFCLDSYLAPRKIACEQFNEKFHKNIDVRVRSDLHNVIKNFASSIIDVKDPNEILDIKQETVKTKEDKGVDK